ncbi:MAG: hypothetical protein GY799_01260 [Desulfobulbaceae bacterium]|nr:hypothetical protein [Desulfobulbaceae bacterium]
MFRPLVRLILLLSGIVLLAASTVNAAGGCSTQECHQGIANIKPDDHEMMRTIKMNASQHGDPDGCVMCHGGNPKATTKEEAHKGVPLPFASPPVPKNITRLLDLSGSLKTPVAPATPAMFIFETWTDEYRSRQDSG